MNYEFNLLHHVGVAAKRARAAAAAETAAHAGDDNTPSGPTGRGVKINIFINPSSVTRDLQAQALKATYSFTY